MNKHTLVHGDCLEEMSTIEDNSVDMVMTDPPYGTTACKWDSVIPFEPMWEQLRRITKDNGAIVLMGNQPFTSALVMSNLKMYRYEWTWEKNNVSGFANAKRRPLKVTENVLVFSKKEPVYFPQGLVVLKTPRIRNAKVGDAVGGIGFYDGYSQTHTNYPKNVLKFALDKNKLHPTQKPVALMKYLIKTYTNEDDLVIDFTMGSGSTGVACADTGRRFWGCELLPEKEDDPDYFGIASKRVKDAYEKPRLFFD